MSMDGQVKWKTDQQPPFVRGGAILADGLLLATDGNTKLYLVEPNPAGFKPLASAVVLEKGDNWAPLALVDGKLLIRGQKELKCLQVAAMKHGADEAGVHRRERHAPGWSGAFGRRTALLAAPAPAVAGRSAASTGRGRSGPSMRR